MRGIGARRIRVMSGDVIVLDGYTLSVDILKEMIAPDKRLLWAFVRNGDNIQPVPYDEKRVLWLSEEDLVRNETDPE